jgi:hypothetical protein
MSRTVVGIVLFTSPIDPDAVNSVNIVGMLSIKKMNIFTTFNHFTDIGKMASGKIYDNRLREIKMPLSVIAKRIRRSGVEGRSGKVGGR